MLLVINKNHYTVVTFPEMFVQKFRVVSPITEVVYSR
jgi:hypothetical protein